MKTKKKTNRNEDFWEGYKEALQDIAYLLNDMAILSITTRKRLGVDKEKENVILGVLNRFSPI